MKMRAAVLREIGLPAPYAQSRPLSVEMVELAAPGPGELTLKIRAAGLCHSDLSAINGDRPWPVPIVIGHEAAGEVVEVGAGVNDLAIGDSVVLVFRPMCGACLDCASGRPALCGPGGVSNAAGSLLGGYRRLGFPVQASPAEPSPTQAPALLNHHMGCAAFAEYATVSRRSVVKVDRELAFVEAALFGCAVMTGAGAVFNTARVEAGARIAVVGLGGVGFSSLMAAVASGARDVVAVDLVPAKLEMARRLGATRVFDARDPEVVAQVKAATEGGVDYAFEMAGSVAALECAYRITRRGGTTVSAGLPNPAAQWPVQAVSLIAEERTIKGSYVGSCVPSRDIPRFVAMYRAGHLPVNELLSETITLDEINPALDRLAQGIVVRQVILPHGA
jgi:alcohol dehydrogenase